MSVSWNARSTFEFGQPQALFEAPLPRTDSLEDMLGSFSVSSDGSKFLFEADTTSAAI